MGVTHSLARQTHEPREHAAAIAAAGCRLHPPSGSADDPIVSADEFFIRSAVPPAVAAPPMPPVRPRRTSAWPVVAIAAVGLALVTGLTVVVWPHGSTPGRPAPATARLFGQQTRTQLPQPVTTDECTSAVRAFPGIDRDPAARAAFVNGCTHG